MSRIIDFVGVAMAGVLAVCLIAPYAAIEWSVYKVRGWCYPYCKRHRAVPNADGELFPIRRQCEACGRVISV